MSKKTYDESIDLPVKLLYLKPEEIKVYLLLKIFSLDGQFSQVSLNHLKRATNFSKNRMLKALVSLQDEGIITKYRTSNLANIYEVNK